MTFNWSRFISYYERGVDRGWGFRDSMQDILGVVHAMPEKVKERIKTLLKIQKSNGNAKEVYYPGSGESIGGGRSDDHLWSIFSVCTYIRETGDFAFLDEIVPYVDGGEGTVKEHLMRGLDFTRNNLGKHGIPLFLKNDWNDTLAFRGMQHGAFYAVDPDCIAFTSKLEWEQIEQWWSLLKSAGTSLIVSIEDRCYNTRVRDAVTEAFQNASVQR